MTPLTLHPSSDMLEHIQIATPCDAKWENMLGDERVRFCGACAKHVYNISRMQREEALGLIQQTEGNICIRLYRRHDGTVQVEDCPVGLAKKAARQFRRLFLASMTLFVTLLAFFWGQNEYKSVGGHVSATESTGTPDEMVLMGEMEIDHAPEQAKKPRVIMGRMKAPPSTGR